MFPLGPRAASEGYLSPRRRLSHRHEQTQSLHGAQRERQDRLRRRNQEVSDYAIGLSVLSPSGLPRSVEVVLVFSRQS